MGSELVVVNSYSIFFFKSLFIVHSFVHGLFVCYLFVRLLLPPPFPSNRLIVFWDESLNVLTFTFCVFQYHTHNLRHADTITVFVVLQYHTLFLDECTHLIRIISLVSHLLLKLFFRHTLDFFQFSVSHSKWNVFF